MGFMPRAYQESVTQNSKKMQKYTIICEIYVKNKQFCHFFAKKPDKTMTTKHVVTYVQMRIEPYIFTKCFQKPYKPILNPPCIQIW